MAELKLQLKKHLADAMRAHDELRKSTLRLALGAITNEEVAGKVARELSTEEELKVIAKEVAKRKDSAQAYIEAGRQELADKELAEADILLPYLPTPLTNTELKQIVSDVIQGLSEELGRPLAGKDLGQVMKLANAKVAGRADGKEVVAEVRAALA